MRACARGVADYLKKAGLAERGLVIGYDTRFASEDFATSAAEVVAESGIKVLLSRRAVPTPVISYGVLAHKAGGAVIITASHNPAIWNGFKYKTDLGSSAPDEVTAQIEGFISEALAGGKINRLPLNQALEQRLIEYVDFDPAYFAQISKLVDLEGIRQAGIKIAIDSMYGVGSGYLRKMLEDGTNRLIEINSERNPLFPGIHHPEPIADNLKKLSDTINAEGAGVGLATDGDADRMGIVDEKGTFLTQLQVYAMLCLYLLEVRGERGAIVKSITTTSMVYRLGEIFNVPVYETSVGFKYVAPLMLNKNALVGGEESGGYGFRGHIAERDGILANLYFLDFMIKTGKTPSELIEYLYSKVGPHHYKRVDVKFPADEWQTIFNRVKDCSPKSIDVVEVVKLDTADGFRFTLADNSWLLIRFSGTEPVLRIYAETDSPERAERILALGKEMAGV